MKKIGLIGGMSWESSQVYYRIINEKVNEILGGFHSCKSVMESVDFAEIETLQHQNNWSELEKLMIKAAQNVEKAGAKMVLLCTNTMHLCSEAMQKNIKIPLLHIASATGESIQNKGLKKVLLLGTRFTMENDFYTNILAKDFGIETIIPNGDDRQRVHDIIYQELVHGKIVDNSRENYKRIIEKSVEQGAQGVILGCTEIPLLIQQTDVSIPVFDTTRIHAETAVKLALT